MPELIQSLIAAGLLDSETANVLLNQLDPVQARQQAEQALFDAVLTALQNQQSEILGVLPDTLELSRDIFESTTTGFTDELLPTMQSMSTDRATVLTANLSVGLTDEVLTQTFNRVNEGVLQWASDYYLSLQDDDHGSLPNLNVTSRSRFLDLFDQWNRGALPNQQNGLNRGLPNLIDALNPVFGPTRAEAIASTEVTRIFGEATTQAGRLNDTVIGFGWATAEDEIVCPICRPLNRQFIPKDTDDFQHPTRGAVRHPAHTRCRCDKELVTELTRHLWN